MKNARARRATRMVIVAAATLSMLATTGFAADPQRHSTAFQVDGTQVSVDIHNQTFRISTSTLAAALSRRSGPALTVSAATPDPLGRPSRVSQTSQGVSWTYPTGLSVQLGLTQGGDGVTVVASSTRTQTLDWPVSSTDRSIKSIEYPNGGGQTIPIRDTFWNSTSSDLPDSSWAFAGDLTLPLWGLTGSAPGTGVAFYTTTDIGTSLGFASTNGALSATATHSFSASEGTGSFQVAITPTNGSPIAAAAPYRQYLQEHNQLVTLTQKIAKNPDVKKLIGAPEAYVWGDGRTPDMISQLQNLGIKNMWLGYDSDAYPASSAFVSAANSAGYLVGPYDTWANAQDPATADSPSSSWPGTIYPDACVQDSSGNIVTGFGGRGCYVSSKALDEAQQASGVISQRVASTISNGATSYFLDVDAAGQLFQDYSPAHPETQAQDRALRLKRLTTLADGGYSSGKKLVVGSESAAAWSNPAVDFTNGASTATTDGLWSAEQDKSTWGAYYPDTRPAFYFKPIELSADVTKAMFDPEYRVPLYEAVLHDSVISTDRWELGYYKLPDAEKDRALQAMLYNTPLNYVLDETSLATQGPEIAKFTAFFAGLQKAAGTQPLTSFSYVGGNALVQQTQFSSKLTVRANFGTTVAGGLNPGCVSAQGPSLPAEQLCVQ